MVLDKNTLFSDEQAITVTAASTDVLDLGALGIVPYNQAQLLHRKGLKEIPLLIQVVENFATLTSLKIAVETDDNSAFSSAKEVLSQTVLVADLVAGFISAIDKIPRGVNERYMRIKYTVNGADATAGKITAGIVLAVDGAYKG
jgi:hypothetical protein